MNLRSVIILLIGILIGWVMLPSAHAGEDNTYKGLLREAINILHQIQVSSIETAENTKAIKEKLGAK